MRADRSGIASEILFGPLSDLACSCGKYTGPQHAGTVCERCGVLCGSSSLRAERFGHIELPGGVVHPALAPILGAVLGLGAEDVLAVARNEAWLDGDRAVRSASTEGDFVDHSESMGIRVLRERLSGADSSRMPAEIAGEVRSFEELLVDAVPVIPPGDRPLLRIADPTVLALQAGPVNSAYRVLTERALRLRRLVELNAPLIILRNEEGMMQRAFERLVSAVSANPAEEGRQAATAPRRLWKEPAPQEGPLLDEKSRLPADADSPWAEEELDPEVPCGCLWLDEGRMLVQLPDKALVLSLADGRVISRHEISRLRARSTDEAGRRVVFLGEYPGLQGEGGELTDVAVLDTKTGEWLATYPPDLRSVTVINDQPEDAFLQDFRTGENVRLRIESDRPGLFAVARDHRFVWAGGCSASGSIVNTDTGIVHVEVPESSFDPSDGPFLLQDGSTAAELAEEDAEESAPGAAAFVLTPAGRWRFLDPEGVVLEDERKLFTLAFPRAAAAFDASGDRLLVLTPKEALVITIADPPSITERIGIEPACLLRATK